VVRDGWGYRKETDGNTLTKEHAPLTYALMQKYPNVLLNASGESVGLPPGYIGNSEVGHMTMGAGRVIFQSLDRINKSIREGDFFKIPEFLEAVENCRKHNSALHIMGLVQSAGVHAHRDHLFALLDLCKMQNFSNVLIHAFTDGRDAPVNESMNQLKMLQDKIAEVGFGKIVTVAGRYYAMDRDRRWERTKKFYDCMVYGQAPETSDIVEKLHNCYSQNETDEFIVPFKLKGYEGIKEKDSVIFFNFRTDRTRQITAAMIEDNFEGWIRKPLDIFFVAMTQFYTPMNAKVAFLDQNLAKLLGEVISDAGLKQLRISETEKYAHVTFFFNGQTETPYANEDRIVIPSPKVATFDLDPEMSVRKITDELVKQMRVGSHDFIVTNLVNADMVGHTGVLEAIYIGVKAVDECLDQLVKTALETGYTVLVTADHGSAEEKTATHRTSHTTNPVPFMVISSEPELQKVTMRQDRGFDDVAPTILHLLGIEKPKEMTGESLII